MYSYKKPPAMGPWLTLGQAAEEVGLNVDDFVSLIAEKSLDIPHRYADSPDGFHRNMDEMRISPIAMVSLFLLNGMHAKAKAMVDKMENFHLRKNLHCAI